jgi:hypothetical protein
MFALSSSSFRFVCSFSHLCFFESQLEVTEEDIQAPSKKRRMDKDGRAKIAAEGRDRIREEEQQKLKSKHKGSVICVPVFFFLFIPSIPFPF